MNICPSCQAENPEIARFCVGCGQPLPRRPLSTEEETAHIGYLLGEIPAWERRQWVSPEAGDLLRREYESRRAALLRPVSGEAASLPTPASAPTIPPLPPAPAPAPVSPWEWLTPFLEQNASILTISLGAALLLAGLRAVLGGGQFSQLSVLLLPLLPLALSALFLRFAARTREMGERGALSAVGYAGIASVLVGFFVVSANRRWFGGALDARSVFSAASLAVTVSSVCAWRWLHDWRGLHLVWTAAAVALYAGLQVAVPAPAFRPDPASIYGGAYWLFAALALASGMAARRGGRAEESSVGFLWGMLTTFAVVLRAAAAWEVTQGILPLDSAILLCLCGILLGALAWVQEEGALVYASACCLAAGSASVLRPMLPAQSSIAWSLLPFTAAVALVGRSQFAWSAAWRNSAAFGMAMALVTQGVTATGSAPLTPIWWAAFWPYLLLSAGVAFALRSEESLAPQRDAFRILAALSLAGITFGAPFVWADPALRVVLAGLCGALVGLALAALAYYWPSENERRYFASTSVAFGLGGTYCALSGDGTWAKLAAIALLIESIAWVVRGTVWRLPVLLSLSALWLFGALVVGIRLSPSSRMGLLIAAVGLGWLAVSEWLARREGREVHADVTRFCALSYGAVGLIWATLAIPPQETVFVRIGLVSLLGFVMAAAYAWVAARRERAIFGAATVLTAALTYGNLLDHLLPDRMENWTAAWLLPLWIGLAVVSEVAERAQAKALAAPMRGTLLTLAAVSLAGMASEVYENQARILAVTLTLYGVACAAWAAWRQSPSLMAGAEVVLTAAVGAAVSDSWPRLSVAGWGVVASVCGLVWLLIAGALHRSGRMAWANAPFVLAACVTLCGTALALLGVGETEQGETGVLALATGGMVFLGMRLLRGGEGWIHLGVAHFGAAYAIILYDKTGRIVNWHTLDLYLAPLGLYLLVVGWMAERKAKSESADALWWLGLLTLFTPTFLAHWTGAGDLHTVLLMGECVVAVYWGIAQRLKAFFTVGVGFAVAFALTTMWGALVSLQTGTLAIILGLMILTVGFYLVTHQDAVRSWLGAVREQWRAAR